MALNIQPGLLRRVLLLVIVVFLLSGQHKLDRLFKLILSLSLGFSGLSYFNPLFKTCPSLPFITVSRHNL